MSLSRALYPRARARFEVSMCTQTALHSLGGRRAGPTLSYCTGRHVNPVCLFGAGVDLLGPLLNHFNELAS